MHHWKWMLEIEIFVWRFQAIKANWIGIINCYGFATWHFNFLNLIFFLAFYCVYANCISAVDWKKSWLKPFCQFALSNKSLQIIAYYHHLLHLEKNLNPHNSLHFLRFWHGISKNEKILCSKLLRISDLCHFLKVWKKSIK